MLSPAASPPSSTANFASNSHLNFSPSSPPHQTGFSPQSPPNQTGFSPQSPPNRSDYPPVKRVPSIPRVPVPQSEKPPLPVQRPTPPSSINHDIDEPPRRQSTAAEQQHQQQQPQEEEDPLEDFIPDPEADHPAHEHENEPDLDGPGSAIEEASSEENNGPWTPPDIEPVAAPLNKLHYVCYQDHRAMPPAANRWHALPCMTCQKFDREVRHRCVFCCLRICAGCYQTLQKTPNRSLERLMDSLGESRA
ncbi:hypothetical protein BDW42DRAFT_165953 [Aspergillus taichungensis]|uniref:Uncharacterized protein n=1 Tax=Aspergillus taichungensis TaxID=482145 RepID=A0A2J5HZ19_9EURO|nr:hypothetical protein BDW42DRAFT_165953 [Aspergillus taichungensis]